MSMTRSQIHRLRSSLCLFVGLGGLAAIAAAEPLLRSEEPTGE